MQTIQLFPDMPKYHVTPASEEIYAAFPRKVGKPEAMKAIHRAIKQFGFEHVLQRTKAFADAWEHSGKPLTFVPYPSTFFHQERFNDDYAAIFPVEHVGRPVNGISVAQQKRAVEQLLEANQNDLRGTVTPNPNCYVNGVENGRYQKDLHASVVRRALLKEERKKLEAKLKELNRKLIQ